jgi:hypothetical protein
MAKSPTTRDFAEQTTESAMQAGTNGMDLMRMVAEQSLNLSKAAFEGYLTAARQCARGTARDRLTVDAKFIGG